MADEYDIYNQRQGGNIGAQNPNPYGVDTGMGMPQGPPNTWDQSRNPTNLWRTSSRDTQAPSAWSPSVPQANQYTRPGTQAQTRTWDSGIPGSVTGWDTQPKRDQYSQYLSSMLPYQQYQQNQYQYGQDFNEAARRWDQQMGWTQATDQYNMDLTGRQQTMAEWTAQQANNQWYDQFGQTQRNDAFSQGLADRQFGQTQRNDAFSQGLADRQFGQTQRNDAFSQGLADRQFGQTQRNDAFSQDLANRQFGQQGQQFADTQRLQYAQQRIDEMYNQGRISNEQRQLALGELTQQQNYAFAQQNLAAQQGWNREELASTNAYRGQQDVLARAQMAQEMQMQQAALEAQRQNAVLAATGRNLTPNVRWMARR